jgi:hypothetical protein
MTGLQARQVPPRVPQAAGEPGWQAPLAQQPAGQDCASHTQEPLTHLVPRAQELWSPQRQVPRVALHPSLTTGSQFAQAAPPRPQVTTDCA